MSSIDQVVVVGADRAEKEPAAPPPITRHSVVGGSAMAHPFARGGVFDWRPTMVAWWFCCKR